MSCFAGGGATPHLFLVIDKAVISRGIFGFLIFPEEFNVSFGFREVGFFFAG